MPANPWLRHVPAVAPSGAFDDTRPSTGPRDGPGRRRQRQRPPVAVLEQSTSDVPAALLFRVPPTPVRLVQRRT